MEGDKDGNFNCKKCPRIFFTKVGFKIHLSRHGEIELKAQNTVHDLPQDERPLQPNECKKSNNNAHVKKTPYQCQECPKVYKTKYRFQLHTKAVHGKIKPYPCQKCDKSYGYKHILRIHVNMVHEKITPYQCQECQLTCRCKSEFQRHMNIVHEKLKPFTCLQCDNSFGYKNTFQTHVNNVHRKLTS